jgi:long-chain fatty acid transport protein
MFLGWVCVTMMQMPLRLRALVPLALVIGAVGFAGEASASGLDVPMIGTSMSGAANADAAAIHWNPAMIAYQERGQVNLSLGVVAGRIDYQRTRRGLYQIEDGFQFSEPIDVDYVDPTKTGTSPSVTSPIASPAGDLFVTAPIVKDRLAIGVGVYAPYAAIVSFPREGAQRWQMQEASIAVLHSTLALSVKAHEKISFGAGVSYVLATGSISRVQDFGSVQLFADGLAQEPIGQPNDFGEEAPTTVRELDVLARPFAFTNGVSHGVTFNVGVALRPIDRLTIGFNYDHGSRVRLRGDFTMDMNEEFFTQDLASQGLQFPALVSGEAELAFRLPKRMMLGFALQATKRLRLDLDLELVFWKDLESFDIVLDSEDLEQEALGIPARNEVSIPRNWNNAVHVEVGSHIALSEKVLLFALLGYHSPASPDSTIDAASPDGHRLLGGLGSRFAFNERIALLVDGELQGILPREVTKSHYDLGNGTYRLLIGTVAAHLQIAFGRGGWAKRNASPQGEAL